jgi:hypothetical protein
MWWDVLLDLFIPGRDLKKAERRKSDPDTLRVLDSAPDAFKRRLNESGWLDDEVVAAGVLQQGKAPSMLAMMTGAALFEVMRPRRAKSLPREFCVAVTSDRVVAYGVSPWKEGDGSETEHVVKVKREEHGSWPRDTVRLTDVSESRAANGGTLDLAGKERLPVRWDGDSGNRELVELLRR